MSGFATEEVMKALGPDSWGLSPPPSSAWPIAGRSAPPHALDRATYENPHRLAEGMTWVLVNGVPVIVNGEFTDALPGVVLRR